MPKCPQCGAEIQPGGFELEGECRPKIAAVISFPTTGTTKCWALTQAQIDLWQGLYPGLDVLQVCRQAKAYIDTGTRYTARGMPKFMIRQLDRAVERRSGVQDRRAPPPVESERWVCRHLEKCATRGLCDNKKILGHPEKQAS